MVEADESLGGAAIQHREIEGHESPLFQSYFGYQLTYLEGGVDSGLTHVEPTKDVPHLYKFKGIQKGTSLLQMQVSKNSLRKGDSFILFANPATVWSWHGESANPHEKARAITLDESMCTEGTVVTMDQGDGDEEDADFWAY
jgi:gelsolin